MPHHVGGLAELGSTGAKDARACARTEPQALKTFHLTQVSLSRGLIDSRGPAQRLKSTAPFGIFDRGRLSGIFDTPGP